MQDFHQTACIHPRIDRPISGQSWPTNTTMVEWMLQRGIDTYRCQSCDLRASLRALGGDKFRTRFAWGEVDVDSSTLTWSQVVARPVQLPCDDSGGSVYTKPTAPLAATGLELAKPGVRIDPDKAAWNDRFQRGCALLYKAISEIDGAHVPSMEAIRCLKESANLMREVQRGRGGIVEPTTVHIKFGQGFVGNGGALTKAIGDELRIADCKFTPILPVKPGVPDAVVAAMRKGWSGVWVNGGRLLPAQGRTETLANCGPGALVLSRDGGSWQKYEGHITCWYYPNYCAEWPE